MSKFKEEQFRNEWGRRGVGMGMGSDYLKGAEYYHDWVIKKELKNLHTENQALRKIVESQLLSTNALIEFLNPPDPNVGNEVAIYNTLKQMYVLAKSELEKLKPTGGEGK